MRKQTGEPVTDPMDYGVEITLDRPRKLIFDMNAAITLQKLTGFKMLSPNGWAEFAGDLITPEDGPNLEKIRALLYAELLHDDTDGYRKPAELTLEMVGGLVSMSNLMEVINKVFVAKGISAPDAEEKQARPFVAGANG